jgi:hypothetical protein
MPEYEVGVQEIPPEGDYAFVVDDAGEKQTAKGDPKIELQLLIKYNGRDFRVFDNLVFTKNAFWKIDQFRLSTGEKLITGQKVNLEAEDCVDRRGKCHLYIDTFEGRSRNKVDAYLPPGSNGESQPQISGGGNDPDDIPFAPPQC